MKITTLIGLLFILMAGSWSNFCLASQLQRERLYQSPYFLGRGDTGIADSDNHEAIFYNPASLALGKGLLKEVVFASPAVSFSDDTKNLVRKIVVEDDSSIEGLRQHVGKNQHLSVNNFTGVVFRRAALGVLASTRNNILLYKSPENRGVEILDASTTTATAVTFSIAEGFLNQKLLVGTTLKYVNYSASDISINVLDAEDLADQLSSGSNQQKYTGSGADLGLLYQIKGRNTISFGLTIENLGNLKLVNLDSSKPSSQLHQTVNFGAGFVFGTKLSQMKFNVDVRDLVSNVEKNLLRKTSFGSELNFANAFGFTAGLNQGYPSAGMFLNLYIVRFDVGTHTEEIGSSFGARPDSRYFFRLTTGF